MTLRISQEEMRLRYIYHGQDKEPHPFHVKSTWIPPIQQLIQPSVALELLRRGESTACRGEFYKAQL